MRIMDRVDDKYRCYNDDKPGIFGLCLPFGREYLQNTEGLLGNTSKELQHFFDRKDDFTRFHDLLLDCKAQRQEMSICKPV